MTLLSPSLPQQLSARQYLRDLLDWTEFDEIRELRRSIHLDIYYWSIVFAAEKGFSWPAVAEVANLTGQLLEKTKGVSPLQAIQVLQEKLVNFQVKLSPTQLRAVLDYFHNTFIKHYWLYQFVLTRERNCWQSFDSLEVYVPPSPLPLSEGMELEAWKFEQQVSALCAAEDEKRASVARIRETLWAKKEELLQEVYRSVERQTGGLSREDLVFLVREAIKAQLQTLQEIIQHEIETTFEILQLRLQKKTLMLNPPPIYPPIPTPESQKEGKVKKKSSESKHKGEDKKPKKKK
uniref:Uncharacterized protein n=1 Tax=Anolis carolinensis TaxID=28377 RepID=G1KJM4_ANOCA|nr:PREDICTED: uncharacterized protein C8orf74 homolog [Anolis carolinensis]|eukprot:XP_016848388.1 PREDICTED: uncharacterized protein C8orf74 homolog [Anolis carolinensis]